MISEQPTRTIVKELRAAGFAPIRTVGSHTMRQCVTTLHAIPLPDGHRIISPGVVRKVRSVISSCSCGERGSR